MLKFGNKEWVRPLHIINLAGQLKDLVLKLEAFQAKGVTSLAQSKELALVGEDLDDFMGVLTENHTIFIESRASIVIQSQQSDMVHACFVNNVIPVTDVLDALECLIEPLNFGRLAVLEYKEAPAVLLLLHDEDEVGVADFLLAHKHFVSRVRSLKIAIHSTHNLGRLKVAQIPVPSPVIEVLLDL